MATQQPSFFKVGEIRPAEDHDFDYFVNLAEGGGWTKKMDKNGLVAWSRSSENSALKIFKLHGIFKDVSAGTAFDVLMDPQFRCHWDDASITEFDICKLDGYNDIGYYAMKCPAPIKNRDYLNQRSWKAEPGKQYIVFNHSVSLENHPPLKNFVRGISYVTGFIIKPAGEGSSLTYVTQSDPKGAIPKWVINFALTKVAPKLMDRLHTACTKYNDWKTQNKPDLKPWLYPEQNPLPTYPETTIFRHLEVSAKAEEHFQVDDQLSKEEEKLQVDSNEEDAIHQNGITDLNN